MIHVTLDFRSSLPLHRQIREQILLSILSGELGNGERLPSIRDIAITSNVNPNTVARVYRDLEREGWITSRRGSGSFVADIPPERLAAERRARVRREGARLIGIARRFGVPIGEIHTLLEEIAHE